MSVFPRLGLAEIITCMLKFQSSSPSRGLGFVSPASYLNWSSFNSQRLPVFAGRPASHNPWLLLLSTCQRAGERANVLSPPRNIPLAGLSLCYIMIICNCQVALVIIANRRSLVPTTSCRFCCAIMMMMIPSGRVQARSSPLSLVPPE